MAVTATEIRPYEIRGVAEGIGCVFPRDPRNAEYNKLIGYKTKMVSATEHYESFPEVGMLSSGKVWGGWSRSESHAEGTFEYPLVVIDPTTLEHEEGIFYSAADGFDLSLLAPEMDAGDVVFFLPWVAIKVGSEVWGQTVNPVTDYRNEVLYSDDHENAAWTKGGSLTLSADAAVGPYGQTDATHVAVSASTGSGHQFTQVLTGFAPSQEMAVHIWLKAEASGFSWFRISLADDGAASHSVTAWVDVATGAVGSVTNSGNGTGAAVTIYAGPDDWYLAVLTGTPNTSGSDTRLVIRAVSGDGATEGTGDGTHGWLMHRISANEGGPLPINPTTTFSQRYNFLKTTSAVADTGTSGGRYTMWGKPVDLGGSLVGCAGRWVDSGNSTVAFFVSADGGITWTLRGEIATGTQASYNFSETTIARRTNDQLVAFTRASPTGPGALTLTIDADAGTITRPSGSFVDDGFLVDQEIDTDGFDESGNNATWVISTVTALEIIVLDPASMVDEVGDGDETVAITEASGGLYLSTSDDDGVTWSSPVNTGAESVQPDLHRMTDGDLILLASDRYGRSGFTPGGVPQAGFNVTGITAYPLREAASGELALTIAAGAGTITRASGDFEDDGFVVGQEIVTSGFTNAGNNDVWTISAVTALVITVSDATGMVNETGGGDEEVEITASWVNWGTGATIERTYSTDGTFPRAVEISANVLMGLAYIRRDVSVTPAIQLFQFSTPVF